MSNPSAVPVKPPAEWVWVPKVATPAMEAAGRAAQDKWPSAQCDNEAELNHSFAAPRWDAMVQAAPPAPEGFAEKLRKGGDEEYRASQRIRFEHWLTEEHEYAPSDLTFVPERNCYVPYALHLAFQSWLAAQRVIG